MLLVIHKHNLGQGTSNQQDRPGMGTLDLLLGLFGSMRRSAQEPGRNILVDMKLQLTVVASISISLFKRCLVCLGSPIPLLALVMYFCIWLQVKSGRSWLLELFRFVQ